MLAEHSDLAGEFWRVIHFGVAGGEQLMPEERHFLFQWSLGIDHTEHPIGLVDGRPQCPFVAGKDAVHQLVVDGRLVFGMQQLLNHGLIAFGNPGVQVATRLAKAGAAHQMGH